MRTLALVFAALCSTEVFAHSGHGAILAHLHPSDAYLLIALAVALLGAWAAFRIK